MSKPKVFIGSSSEGLNDAEKVKSILERNDFEANIWNDDAFKPHRSYLNSLMQAVLEADFAVLVATKDDELTQRGVTKKAPRDNVIFELGLFMGYIGLNRCVGVFEKDVKRPSDLDGIEVFEYPSKGTLDIERVTTKIAESFKEVASPDNGFLRELSSTALAIGYFKNFVSVVAKAISHEDFKKGREVGFKALIPSSLSDVNFEPQAYYQRHSMEEERVSVQGGRTRTVYKTDKGESLVFHDIPTTLSSLEGVIETILESRNIRNNKITQAVLDRELRNFKLTLEYLVKKDSYARNLVSIEEVKL